METDQKYDELNLKKFNFKAPFQKGAFFMQKHCFYGQKTAKIGLYLHFLYKF